MSPGRDTFAAFVDLQKVFDWVDRDLIFHKLLRSYINGQLYQVIQFICLIMCIDSPKCIPYQIVQISSGFRQDVHFPTLFSIHDLTV